MSITQQRYYYIVGFYSQNILKKLSRSHVSCSIHKKNIQTF